ncbi:MAG: hypothetical protein R3293_19595 [Candidatus Promineifilaceae bacterium]|nr:hypothetical protein [Candidatus Promineifilaceae bacterium]
MEEERIITPLPKALPISGVVLLVLGIVAIPMVGNVFSEQQLSRNAILSGIPFILIFAAIIIFFMSFIWFLSNKMNFRISQRTYSIVEKIIIGGIIVGIVFMFQPWVFVLFRYGFYLLLISTLGFIVWSHIAAAPAEDELAAE